MSNFARSLTFGASAIAIALGMATTASAQSTGTAAVEVEQVVVTGRRGPRTIDGAIVAETVGKSRSTITQEYIENQAAGQSINEVLNLVPGMSFTNNDAYGSSGGNIRLHGFDGARIAQTFDGMPLNDSGNYSLYTNQQLDGELIGSASVNTGTTDVDSPTAAATGGTINMNSINPSIDFGGRIKASIGDNNYHRIFTQLNTGEIGPWGTRAWFAYSDQSYDKYKGEGDLNKIQYNFKVYQPIRDNGDFVSLAGHWNRNRNNNYADMALARNADGSARLADGVSWNSDFDTKYTAPTYRNGVADVDSNSNRYWALRQNPSDTGNLRAQSRFTLTDNLIFTFDPSFQYVNATGGSGQWTLRENDATLRGTQASAAGVDLNGDGDTMDTVRVHSTSLTHTQRYGISSSLIWKLADNHTVRAAYTLDHARHRQTGMYGRIDFSNPTDPRFVSVWAGMKDADNRIVNLDGYELRSRDRLSYAILNQFAVEYAGRFMDDTVRLNVGLRAPFFKREMNQFCYSQYKSSTVVCSTENAVAQTDGTVKLGTRTQSYIAPYSREVEFDDILPNINVSWNFSGPHTVYASYAESLTLPRTDNLYTVFFDGNGDITSPIAQPETTKTYDMGYRYQTGTLIASANVWYTKFNNRIISRYDRDLDISIDANVGDVDLYGFDTQVGWSPIEGLSLYASASYTESEISDDYLDGTTVIRTGGKSLTETPDWTFGGRVQYETGPLQLGAQVKYTGERFVTDENDLYTEGYTVVNADAKFDLGYFGHEGTNVALRVVNLFDEEYFGSLSGAVNSSRTTYGYRGAPRTIQATLTYSF